MNYHDAAQELSSHLMLDIPPIALAYVDAAPIGVRTFDQAVPSACSLWRRAESEVFYAPAEKHFNCPIGAMTMGFAMPASVQEQLGMFVELMTTCGYIAVQEPEKIPSMSMNRAGILYGPLLDFPIDPDLVLMWLTPRQAMFYSEAAGTCRWTMDSPAAVFGRPACAALPVAHQQDLPTLSLGCMGMRTFTEIRQDRLMAVIPGVHVQGFVGALQTTLAANKTMQEFYEKHKAQFTI